MPKLNGSRTHHCPDRSCNRWFSVKSESITKASHLSCKQLAIGIHLFCCNLIVYAAV